MFEGQPWQSPLRVQLPRLSAALWDGCRNQHHFSTHGATRPARDMLHTYACSSYNWLGGPLSPTGTPVSLPAKLQQVIPRQLTWLLC